MTRTLLRRPVGVILLALVTMAAGVFCLDILPVASLPAAGGVSIAVVAPLPGATPQLAASSSGNPLEQQLVSLPGLSEVTSYDTQDGAQLTLRFDAGVTERDASLEVQAALQRASPFLPTTWAWSPYFYKTDPTNIASMMIAVRGRNIPLDQLYTLCDTVIVPRLSKVPGVAYVALGGGDRRAVAITPDPLRLRSAGIDEAALSGALQASSVVLPLGSFSDGAASYPILFPSQLEDATDYAKMPISVGSGRVVSLGDVATVDTQALNNKASAHFDGQDSIIVLIYKRPSANLLRTITGVKRALPELGTELPKSVRVTTVFDRSPMIVANVTHAELTVLVAIILSCIVAVAILRTVAFAIVPLVSVPVVMSAAVVLIYVLGYTIDSFSLTALAISVGIIVDDVVIITEAADRRIRSGMSPSDAASNVASSLGPALIALSLGMASVVAPLGFMPGVLGAYLREVCVCFVVVIIASAFVSLTFSLVVLALLPGKYSMVKKVESPRGEPLPCPILSPAWLLGLLGIMTVGFGYDLWVRPYSLLPLQHTGLVVVRAFGPASISYGSMRTAVDKIERVISSDPGVEHTVSLVGTGSGATVSIGTLLFVIGTKLNPVREQSVVVDRLRAKLATSDSLRVALVAVQDLGIGSQMGSGRYVYTLTGLADVATREAAQRLVFALRKRPQLANVIGDWEGAGLEYDLDINRERVAGVGTTTAAVHSVLSLALADRQLNTIFERTNFARVILRPAPTPSLDDTLSSVFVQASGKSVPLGSMLRASPAYYSPAWVRHKGNLPSVDISFDVTPGHSFSDAKKAIAQTEVAIGQKPTIHGAFQGEASEASAFGGEMVKVTGAAVMAVYCILGILYESLLLPMVILAVIPGVMAGVSVAFAIGSLEINAISAMASVVLFALSARTAVLIVESSLRVLGEHHVSVKDAARAGMRERYRPVIMTSMVAVVGALPLCLSNSPGSEFRYAAGIVLTIGTVLSQVTAVLVIPSSFVVAVKVRDAVARRFTR